MPDTRLPRRIDHRPAGYDTAVIGNRLGVIEIATGIERGGSFIANSPEIWIGGRRGIHEIPDKITAETVHGDVDHMPDFRRSGKRQGRQKSKERESGVHGIGLCQGLRETAAEPAPEMECAGGPAA